jgi:hypothetical protein
MQPRTLDQVIASLSSVYDPQVQNIQAQQAQLPQQLQTDESALAGKQTQAFGDILSGARRRGTGVAFGGIPLGEQAQYNATTYMPALANLRGTYATKGLSLNDAILGINRDRSTQAQGIFENERNYFEQKRQFDEQMAAQERARQEAARAASSAAGSYSPSYGYDGGGGGSAPAAQASGAKFIGNNDLRGHLNYLAQKEGNQDAAIALKYVGNDGKYNLSPYVTNPSIIAALNRMGAVNVYKAPAAPAPAKKATTNQYGGSTAGLAKF